MRNGSLPEAAGVPMSVIEKALEKARQEACRENSAPVAPAAPEKAVQTPPAAPIAPAANKTAAAPAPLLAAGLSDSLMGEEYRLLKERLLSLSKKNGINLFMVTSPMRNEGKTLISCNLALALAYEFDHTALLIDADMRAPNCHRMLSLQRGPGLADCLLHDLDFGEALIRTGLGRLSFLPAGNPVASPPELFSSNRMQSLLLEMKRRYPDRIIIIDTAPILPFAETRALSRAVDGTLLVVRENVTSKNHLESALQCLDSSSLLGLVYNDVGNYGPEKEVFNLSYSY